VGLLFNHIWSFAGDDHRNYVSSTFLQPFIAYATKTKTTFTLNTESTYDWHNEQWTVPINLLVSQLIKIGKQPVQPGAWREGLCRRTVGRAGMGNSFCGHAAVPDREKAGGAPGFLREVV
jgi:hypothetical protein